MFKTLKHPFGEDLGARNYLLGWVRFHNDWPLRGGPTNA